MVNYPLWEKLNANPNLTTDKNEKINSFKEGVAKGSNDAIPPKNNNLFRIMTYNVHYWKNPEETADNMDEIFEIFTKLNPDVIILQEISPSPGFGAGDQFENSDLENNLKKIGYNFIAACNTLQNGWFGNIIASKNPLLINSFTFTNQGQMFEKRCYDYIEIQLTTKEKLGIFGTHLEVQDTTDDTRLAQINEILSNKLNILPNTLIAADFNAVRKKDYQYDISGKNVWDLIQTENQKIFKIFPTPTKVFDKLAEIGYEDSFTKLGWNGPKFTTWTGTVVDFIMLAPTWNLPLAGSYVYYNAASDHLPIIMDIKLN